MSNDSMHPDIPNEYVRPSQSGQIFLFLLALAGIVAIVPWFVMHHGEQTSASSARPSPLIKAEGWINGDAPSRASLTGKVVLVHAWATWCGPCKQFTPKLVDLHERFVERGVVFVGLTSEESFDLPRVEQYVKKANISWLIGWGAGETLGDLGNRYLPTVYVISAEGKVVWDSENGGSIQETLEHELELAKGDRSPK
jgi:thiol-disulfide isomerase/thioredoxin